MITRVTVRGFRGISGTEVFEPEVLTVLTGRNGLGKTTFFDAVEWCLFGQASRLGAQDGVIRNLYRRDADPSVEVVLTLANGTLAVTRTEDGVTLDGAPISERELAEALIVDPEVFPPYLRELGRQVRTVTYLPQEQIRDFVTASLTSERRALLRGLLGVPNAGIVESSIKRIGDHFSLRERDLIEEADNLNSELRQLATGLDFDSTVERDSKELLAAFSKQYGDRSASVESLRAALEANLAARENDVALVDSALASHAATATTVTQADGEIASIEQRQSERRSRNVERELKVSEGTAAIAAAVVAHQDAVRTMVAQQDRLNSMTLVLSKKQQLEELAKQLVNLDRQRDSAVARKAVFDKSAESVRLELNAAQKLADEHRAQLKMTQERAATTSLRADVEKRLANLQTDRRAKEAELTEAQHSQAAASKELSEATVAKAEASASHDLALSSAQREAQVADLRAKLISLVDVADSNCPLCGAEYETHQGLLEHLRRGARPSGINERLRDASSALNAVEARLRELTARERRQSGLSEERRIALEQLDREVVRLTAQHENLSLALRELAQPTPVSTSAEALNKVSELRASLEATERSRSQMEDDLRSMDYSRGRVASEAGDLKSSAPASPSDVTVESIAEARELLSQIRKNVDEREQGVQMLRNTQATLESSLSDARSQSAALEGRLKAERDRKRRALENFDRQCASLGVVGADLQAKGVELQRRTASLQTEIEEIRNAIGRARAIERRQIVNESAIKQRDRQKRLADTEETLSLLRQAQMRFSEIAEQLSARSKTEAESAGALHLVAIQECFNDLYPHGHLNEVEVNFAEGELLVKDRWLTKGVRPQDYSSTGQANVLALSVFLGLALRQTFSLGRFLLLDEPVQNLDDLHFLAFLTLLKRVALSRQVIISTADSNVAEILRRQLRSWSVRNRTWCEYEWVAFEPETGPTIKQRQSKHMAVA
ncbi:MAG: AAA family ATPase [Candidatus Acidiferrales bacterium]